MYEKWLAKAVRKGATYADLRVQAIGRSGLDLRNGKIERSLGGREEGFGVHVLAGGAWGFASSNDVDPGSLERAVERALKMARAAAGRMREPSGVSPEDPETAVAVWKPRLAPADVDASQKEEVVRVMHEAVREFKPVKSTSGSYADWTLHQTFYSSEGARVETSVTRTVAQIHFTAKEAGRVTSRRIRIGATRGFEVFRDIDVARKARQGAEATIRLLRAPAAPSGRMTVVTDPELTGVFSHEAVGHASEADLVAAGESVLHGRLGQEIGSELVTLCDDSTVEGAFGSFPFDDHGVRGRKRVLVEHGVLKGYLCDRVSAHKLGLRSTGSARAESYQERPLVRMTNTFIEAGTLTFDDLLEDVKEGVYCVGSRGGQVDTAKGTFQFSAQEAYRIRRGRLAGPLRDVSLTGFTLETLSNIDGVGKAFAWGDPGYCGKGQYVPVGDGGPHVRIRSAVVGGMA